MGEQQLPLLLKQDLILLIFYLQPDVPQGKSLHPGTQILLRLQRDQGGPDGRHRMPQLLRYLIAVPCGAGGGIGGSPRGEDYRLSGVFPLFPRHGVHAAVPDQNMPDPVLDDPDLTAAEGVDQGVDDIRRPI